MGKCASRGALWAPSFFASSDFIDPNQMKSSVLITDRPGEEAGRWVGEAVRQLPKIELEKEGGAKTALRK